MEPRLLGYLRYISGVPQDTVLGALLFLLYINGITYDLSSDIRLFADDCILYRVIKSQSDSSALQADVDWLHSWAATTWQMQFNSSKCTHILSICRQRNPSLSSYYLGTDQLSSVDSCPYPGITLSSYLRWYKHVSAVCLV